MPRLLTFGLGDHLQMLFNVRLISFYAIRAVENRIRMVGGQAKSVGHRTA